MCPCITDVMDDRFGECSKLIGIVEMEESYVGTINAIALIKDIGT